MADTYESRMEQNRQAELKRRGKFTVHAEEMTDAELQRTIAALKAGLSASWAPFANRIIDDGILDAMDSKEKQGG